MSKGFQYTLETEKIIDYMKLSTKQKLEWLEEINKFNHLFLTKKEKDIRLKLLDGKL